MLPNHLQDKDSFETSKLISKAKDLLWDNIEQHNRDLFIHIAKTNSFPENNKLVFREPFVIGFRNVNTLQDCPDGNSQS